MKTRSYAVVMASLLMTVAITAHAQSLAGQQRTSLFEGDVCSAPCWFGLVPAESTSDDVELLFSRFWNRISPAARNSRRIESYDPNTGLLVDGRYLFSWRQQSRAEHSRTLGSSITMKHGVVVEMHIAGEIDIPLRDVLEVYGQPDLVYLNFLQNLFEFRLIYLTNAFYVVVEDYDGCFVRDALDDFEFSYISIFSAGEALRPFRFSGFQVEQPRLIAMQDGGVNVPIATWESWLNGDSDMTCGQASWSVPEGIVTPDLSALEATATAQASLFLPTVTAQP
jgi:hypothetical protein